MKASGIPATGRRQEEKEMTYTYPSIKYLGPAYPDGAAGASARTLASRVSAGIEVDLWWEPGRVWVAVLDTKTGEAFSVSVADNERALDVFHHPYAYAAAHGVATGTDSECVDSDTSLAA
jgi:hypothetical protein